MNKNRIIMLILFVTIVILIVHIPISKSLYVFNNFEQNIISSKLINDYFSNNQTIKSKAEKTIKTIVLQDLDYENWLDYLEYIDIIIYPVNIIGDSKKDLIIALNITKDIGVIGLYNNINNNYNYYNKLENLTHINSIDIASDKLGRIFIIVNQLLDEKLGAFFTDNYIQIFTEDNKSYKEVFRQSIDYEAFVYEKWIDASIENPKWYKLTEQNIIDYSLDNNGKIVIDLSKILSKYQGYNSSDSIPENFELVEQKNIDLVYSWNNKYNYFIQNEGKIKNTGEIVGIIERSSQFVDSLLCKSDEYFKIIDNNDKIRFIKIDSLSLLND